MLGFFRLYRTFLLGLNHALGMRFKLGLTAAIMFLSLIGAQGQTVRYVTPEGSGTEDGSSWDNAFNLAEALLWAYHNRDNDLWSAAEPLQIWVSNGVHYPRYTNSGDFEGDLSRENTFTLVRNVQLYGGFQGDEVMLSQRVLPLDRNYQTILSGDYNADDNISGFGEALLITGNEENVDRILRADGDLGVAVLDGFQVTGGNTTALGSGLCVFGGEGLYVGNMLFRGNVASGSAGAVFVEGSRIHIENCDFTQNNASNGAGLCLFSDKGSVVKNSQFIGNKARGEGGGLRVGGGVGSQTPEVSNSIFLGNSGGTGGAIYASADLLVKNSLVYNNIGRYGGGLFVRFGKTITIVNSTIVNNTAEVSGGGMSTWHDMNNTFRLFNSIVLGNLSQLNTGESGIHLEDPTDVLQRENSMVQGFDDTANGNLSASGMLLSLIFRNPDSDDYRLLSNSLCVDAGSNLLYAGNGGDLIEDVDLDNNSRLFGTQIDIGAYELQDDPIEIIPSCVTIITPSDGANGVPLLPTIEWDVAPNVTGYRITIGTTAGGGEVLDNVDVEDATSYDLTVELEENTTYYLRIVPYNAAGEATDCAAISFTTETLAVSPDCTSIISPSNEGEDVALDAAILWESVDNADGYRIYVGTTSGGTDIVDGAEVTGTSFALDGGWDEGEVYYVRVVPYNAAGEATECAEISFTTETLPVAPECTAIVSPANENEDVALDAAVIWESVDNADGYRIYVGTTSGGTDVVDGAEVTGTSFALDGGWDEGEAYYVRVVPYNAAGEATECAEISFTTETLPVAPDCAVIISPSNEGADVALDAPVLWESVGNADGYRIYIGTTSGGTDVVDGAEVTGTSFTLDGGWAEGEVYYVRLVPYNAAGEAADCAAISFTTETLLVAPECTVIVSPSDEGEDVALDAAIIWESVDNADGYRIYIGTTSGGTDVVNGEEVTGTSFALDGGWDEGEVYYVRVVPYNAAGEAAECAAISFTTETLLVAPGCTVIISPSNEGADVALDAAIIWESVDNVDGYRIYIGTVSGGTDVVNGAEVTGTSFTLDEGWAEGEVYYVRVVPYNAAGEAAECTAISFTTETLPVSPDCTSIISPANESEDVALDAAIIWESVDDADGYRIYIGTTSRGTDVVDGAEVTGTSFALDGGWDEGEAYYARVVPYNAAGEATGCTAISFTTETLPVAPDCAVIISPSDEGADVALDAAVIWESVDNADGYRIYVGTTSGGTDVVDGAEVTGTSFALDGGWDEGEAYYVRVVPYNAAGEATGCTAISFTTETLPVAPDCAVIISPSNEGADVALDAPVLWESVGNADGYRIYIGTTSGGTDVVNGAEVTDTSFTLDEGWDEGEAYYVRVVPYNAEGEAAGCAAISFTTETLPVSPDCTSIISPSNEGEDVALDAAILWESVDNADGYRIYIGTVSGGTDVVNGAEVTGTSFALDGGWDEGEVYYVRVVPYNAAGEAAECAAISFTTETLLVAPECTLVTFPEHGAENVALDAAVVWERVADAAGYRVFIGTALGLRDVVDGDEVTSTSYPLLGQLQGNGVYYLQVVPFNEAGEAVGCMLHRFSTAVHTRIGRTRYGFSPNGDGINDQWQIDGIEDYPENTVFIYNRWGDMVFQTNNYDNQSRVFNGVANRLNSMGGGILPDGTYFFNIHYRDGTELKQVEGFLVIKR